MPQDYSRCFEVPSVDDDRRLRTAAGLTPRSERAAAAGLPQTAVGVVVRQAGKAVGMGRAIGDGLFYQLDLMRRLAETAPAEAHVSLIADGRAHQLYAQHGFAPTAPASIGMVRWIGR